MARTISLVLDGDLLDVEGRFLIDDGEVWVEFMVTWRHPVDGIGGVYRGRGGGFPPGTRYSWEMLAANAEDAVSDAEYDFAHDGAHFARDLRTTPVRDTTDLETRAALRAGPPYPRASGRSLAKPVDLPDLPPGWEKVPWDGTTHDVGEPDVIRPHLIQGRPSS